MKNNNRSAWPYFDEEMIEATAKILKSGKVNYWTGDIHTLDDGTTVRGENGLFEYEFAQYHKAPYSIALANGTLALELALQAFNIGSGDEVITTTRTFIASASACIMRGAKPVFADVELNSQNISAQTIAPLITKNTRAVIAVHLGGWACELDEIKKLLDAKEHEFGHKIYLIEDCAQCLGGEYKGQKLGTIGDAGCFSFCQDKIITTGGEGGMLLLKDKDAYRRAWSFKDHGKDFDKYNTTLNHPLVDLDKAHSSSYYSSIGTNWRMTEIQAAIGRIALAKLDSWNLAARKKYAQILNTAFKTSPGLRVEEAPTHIVHAYYKYYVFLEISKLKDNWDRNAVIQAIAKEGIVCQFGSTWAIGKEDAWKDVQMPNRDTLNLQVTQDLPNDLAIGSSVIMFQVHPTLSEQNIHQTISVVNNVMKQAIK
ncbi:DegT/DnrJ/EryC1/StrS family aminotransferase [Lentisphaera profundi]|uniref:DegT/DnrJ/EryC1/StrS family aminotransferase n=1 Tax=Lentisphaera profundi TaxID=1658616 RepID=A0ABY7W2F6_9BACT|nr:DegT/DnrJ/EryC1/StrS family aminotransferase [Lentisphaera profundi]WDE99144.1 DegT/DnrJ/EryC1/StrS family aminotransferase [Lentisphaera profundi]